MRAPDFWNSPRQKPGFLPILLTPLAKIWQSISTRKMAAGAWGKMSVPVICVGNINVGGTGKTPTVIAIQAFLAQKGLSAHIVSRGFGGSEIGPLRVDERLHTTTQVGDEPLLASAFGPVWVAKNRAAGAKQAIKNGADLILLDDGFQNPSIFKDLSIVVVDAQIGFGNGRVMPAGPLRETLKSGLLRADLIVSIGNSNAQKTMSETWPEITGLPHVKAELQALETGMDWHGLRVIAFAGIGRPAKFFDTLKAQGAEIIATHEFADHAEYSDAVLQRLRAEAQKNRCQLVTTEKDAIRLPKYFRPEVLTLPVRLHFDNPAILHDRLQGLFANKP